MALASLQDRVSNQHPFTSCLECTERNVFSSGFQKATESGFRRKCDVCKAGGREYKSSEPPIFVPVQQNYPPCDECTLDNVYCHGFEKDIRNRCEACLKGEKGAAMIWCGSMDRLGFEKGMAHIAPRCSPVLVRGWYVTGPGAQVGTVVFGE